MPGDPTTPRPAATVILLRRGGKHTDRALEVLLVQRNHEAKFMPGVWVFPGGAVGDDDVEAARETRGDFADEIDDDELAHRACAVRELEEEAGISLSAAELRPWSRWITPEVVPIRFDTRFYLALAPAHSPPKPDGAETVDAGWFEPRAALDRHRAGGLELVFPTIKHLESLLPYKGSEEALAAVAELPPTPVLPRVVGEGERRRVVLPGEAGYE
ncbi:MAG TPA: NUDIX hydrolase [Solirubrobacterales bacterium]|nr:NUDIX hydrolase [Solirubrobacterales bacterium]